MALFPMCVDLSDQAVLVVGEGPEADSKAAKMAPFCKTVLRCPYPPEYDAAPALVILAQKDHPDNESLAAHFRSLHIPVNVADRPELCDFRFPSLITRGDVTVSLTTGGKAPVLGTLLRERIECALPEDLEAIAQTAAELTARLRQSTPDPRERTRLLRELLRKVL